MSYNLWRSYISGKIHFVQESHMSSFIYRWPSKAKEQQQKKKPSNLEGQIKQNTKQKQNAKPHVDYNFD